MNSKGFHLIYPDLSYRIVGVCYKVHNELGRYCKEKQYGDLLERKLIDEEFSFKRELTIGETGNIVDFLVEEKIIVELKAKRVVQKTDYIQAQRYLQETGNKLCLLINFRQKYLSPKRIVLIE